MLVLTIKFIHVIVVALYTGNIFLSMLWMRQAVKSGNQSLVNHTTRVIIKSDRLITIPAVVIILLAGVFSAMLKGYSIHGTGWIIWSFVMLLIAGFAYSVKLVKIHRAIVKETEGKDPDEAFSPGLLKQLSARKTWILIVAITTVLAFAMMVMRHPA